MNGDFKTPRATRRALKRRFVELPRVVPSHENSERPIDVGVGRVSGNIVESLGFGDFVVVFRFDIAVIITDAVAFFERLARYDDVVLNDDAFRTVRSVPRTAHEGIDERLALRSEERRRGDGRDFKVAFNF